MENTQIIPDFLVIGAVKAGTTSLHAYLDQHPEIYLSPIKETNFFSLSDMQFTHFRKDYRYDVTIDFERYLSRRPLVEKHIAHVLDFKTYEALFDDAQEAAMLGEVCNSYLICPSSAKAIYQQNPKAKIIAVLRNPVERAFSQYLMNIKEGKTTESDFITEIKADLALNRRGWGVSHQYHELGHYASQLRPYFETFPNEQIKVLFFDDFKKDSTQFLKDLFNFLGVQQIPIDTSVKLNQAGKPRLGKLNFLLTQTGIISFLKSIFPRNIRQQLAKLVYTKKGLPKLQTEEREYLLKYYRDETANLETLLGKNLDHWKQ